MKEGTLTITEDEFRLLTTGAGLGMMTVNPGFSERQHEAMAALFAEMVQKVGLDAWNNLMHKFQVMHEECFPDLNGTLVSDKGREYPQMPSAPSPQFPANFSGQVN